MQSLVDKYSKKELESIVKISSSYRDLARKLGYTSFSGDLKKNLEEKISQFNTDILNCIKSQQ